MLLHAPSSTKAQPSPAHSEKNSAALLSMLAALLMTALKLAVALMSGSIGVLSDAIHSGVDLLASGLTLVSVRIADRPADANHPYGHARFENISAFFETLLMMGSAFWIASNACRRIFVAPATIDYSEWPVLVLVLSMVVDRWRSRQMRRVAVRHSSAALEADALHFSTDIWSTLAVLIGLLASWLGARLHIGWLHYADPLAALFVAGLILRLSWQIAQRAIYVLTDAVPTEILAQVERAVSQTPGVLGVERLRMRRSGSRYFVDLTLLMPRQLTFSHSEDLVREATKAVEGILPGADVVIHTLPRSLHDETVFDKIRAVAARNNVIPHEVTVRSVAEGEDRPRLHMEQHLELPEEMSLLKAHQFVRGLEDRIRAEIPEVASILTHIESEPGTIEQSSTLVEDAELTAALYKAAATLPEIMDVHAMEITRSGPSIHISCHCTLPDSMPMQEVHSIISALEDRFKQCNPQIKRVLVHPEPESDNQHG